MGLPASFADLAERHRPELLGYLVRILGDQHDAQDACQDALLRAHRAFGRLAPDSNCRAWLYRIATNSARDVARRRARGRARTADLDLDTLPAGAALAPDQGDAIRAVTRAVDALPPRQRAALVLRQFQGLTYEEIAGTLGGNAAAARANVYQALKKLRATLGGTR
jgi:RNA polymerase sigma-70 factor (ECF subfamily)